MSIAAALLQLPLWLVLSAFALALIGELAASWRGISLAYWAFVLAALLAQLSSVFISPFSWPLRFGFFFALLATALYLYSTQTNDV